MAYFCGMKRIAIFASGTGSNATAIVNYFADHKDVEVSMVLSNKPSAKVLDMAKANGIPTRVFSRSEFYDSQIVADELDALGIDMIALAGFLWLIPPYLVTRFDRRMVNVHPALLPKFGGKGMYGMNVHKAVVAAGEKESGPTFHFVNERFDEGEILFQARVELDGSETPEEVAAKVLKLEHLHFAPVLERLLVAE